MFMFKLLNKYQVAGKNTFLELFIKLEKSDEIFVYHLRVKKFPSLYSIVLLSTVNYPTGKTDNKGKLEKWLIYESRKHQYTVTTLLKTRLFGQTIIGYHI